jgi:hypothetical protein
MNDKHPSFGDTLSQSARCRKAATMCRRTAISANNPTDWLEFADDWDKLARQIEQTPVYEAEFKAATFITSAMQAIAEHKRTLH